ncbi:chemerin-like receptor 1 [Pelodytes ibericus]
MKTDNVAIQYTSFVLHILTCAIGLLGNATVICVNSFMLKGNKSKSWFLNLAVADFIFLLFLPLNAFALFTGNWPFGTHVCKAYHFLSISNMYASIFFIVALNIDRVLSVATPIWHHKFFSHRVCYCTCALIWTITILASLPAIFFSVEYNNGENIECRLFDIGHFNSSHTLTNIEESNLFWADPWIQQTNSTHPNIGIMLNQTEGVDLLTAFERFSFTIEESYNWTEQTNGTNKLKGNPFHSDESYFNFPPIPFEIPQCTDKNCLSDSHVFTLTNSNANWFS